MANLKILGGPIAPVGKTLYAASLHAKLMEEYSDGENHYPTNHYAEWDATNSRWKPEDEADGTFWYLPSAGYGDPVSPEVRFVETQTYTDGSSQSHTWKRRIVGDENDEWHYADPTPDTLFVPYGRYDLPVIDVVQSGVPNDGTTSVNASLVELLDGIGSDEREIWFRDGVYLFSEAFTFPSNIRIRMFKGASFKSNLNIVRIKGELNAGLYRIFDDASVIVFDRAPTLYVEWWGGKGDFVTNNAFALQKAVTCIESCSVTTGVIEFGNGQYLFSAGVTISRDRINVIGKGKNATMLLYNPTANGTFLTFSRGVLPIYQCSLRDLSIYSTETSFEKTALRLHDVREFLLRSVVIAGQGNNATFSGPSGAPNSIGLHQTGRDTTTFDDFVSYADRSIVIEANSNEQTLDLDSTTFRDCYLTSSGDIHPIIDISGNTSMMNVIFEGRQSWAFGLHGIRYVKPIEGVTPYSLTLKNVRWEQSENTTGYVVYIDGGRLYNLYLENVNAAIANSRGFYLRNVERVRFQNCMYVGTGIALDVDHTVKDLVLENWFAQVGSSMSLGGLILAEAQNHAEATAGHYAYQRYLAPSNIFQTVERFGVKTWHGKGRLASGNTYTAGQAVLTNGSKTVSLIGGGTWIAEDAGRLFVDAGGVRYIIDSVAGDGLSLTLKTPYAGASSAGASYTILRAHVTLPILNTYKEATVKVTVVGATKTEYGVFVIRPTASVEYSPGLFTAAVKVAGDTPNVGVFGPDSGAKLFLLWSAAANIAILNQLGETVEYTVEVSYQ